MGYLSQRLGKHNLCPLLRQILTNVSVNLRTLNKIKIAI